MQRRDGKYLRSELREWHFPPYVPSCSLVLCRHNVACVSSPGGRGHWVFEVWQRTLAGAGWRHLPSHENAVSFSDRKFRVQPRFHEWKRATFSRGEKVAPAVSDFPSQSVQNASSCAAFFGRHLAGISNTFSVVSVRELQLVFHEPFHRDCQWTSRIILFFPASSSQMLWCLFRISLVRLSEVSISYTLLKCASVNVYCPWL